MIRKVVRPETESHFIEWPFHWIKDEHELRNVMKGVKEEDVFVVMRAVDTNSFQPIHYFAIRKEGRPFSEWLKYGSSLEVALNAKEKSD